MAWVFVRYAPTDSPLYAIEQEARAARRGLMATLVIRLRNSPDNSRDLLLTGAATFLRMRGAGSYPTSGLRSNTLNPNTAWPCNKNGPASPKSDRPCVATRPYRIPARFLADLCRCQE
jgi:hypothetical protein